MNLTPTPHGVPEEVPVLSGEAPEELEELVEHRLHVAVAENVFRPLAGDARRMTKKIDQGEVESETSESVENVKAKASPSGLRLLRIV